MSSTPAFAIVTKSATVPPERGAGGELVRMVSEQEYWEQYYAAETACEWNNGRLEEKPVSDHLTYLVYLWFLKLLDHYLTVRPIARMAGLEMGFRLVLPARTVIRKPDLGIVRNDNPVPLKPGDRSYGGIFDLCIEALSDSTQAEAMRDTVTKKAEYTAAKVPEYYILHHDKKLCVFYGRNGQGDYAPMEVQDGVIHSRVLPGFRFRPAHLQSMPGVEELVTDPVYKEFVLPAWQADRRKMEAETRARREAEKEVARLKKLLAEQAR